MYILYYTYQQIPIEKSYIREDKGHNLFTKKNRKNPKKYINNTQKKNPNQNSKSHKFIFFNLDFLEREHTVEKK